ncbi:MAG: nucleotidyltransferase domain-containing protein [Deltaproteobacteria bacterium]|nr:nucleotidyltransferase domain-containing protein [Deltaproteobacteria bacterium]
MIKHQKLPENALQLLPKASDYLETHPKVLFAYLFGGLVKGKPQPLSDVDIAVYLAENLSLPTVKLDILGKLIDILQTDEIDLVVLNTAELPLIINVLKSKKVIVEIDPFARHTFESLAMRKYFDFSIKESAILQRRYLHG